MIKYIEQSVDNEYLRIKGTWVFFVLFSFFNLSVDFK